MSKRERLAERLAQFATNAIRGTGLPLHVRADAEVVLAEADAIMKLLLPSEPRYQVGDFVQVYLGMGETAFGTIEALESNGVRYRGRWNGVDEGFQSFATFTDLRGPATPSQELENYRIRSGGR